MPARGVTGVWGKVSPAFRTELFLKTGLVTMGASLDFFKIMAIGAKGVIQAVIGVTLVWFFAWWLGGKMRLDDKLRAVMATSVSIHDFPSAWSTSYSGFVPCATAGGGQPWSARAGVV